jgi:hypothetical protein
VPDAQAAMPTAEVVAVDPVARGTVWVATAESPLGGAELSCTGAVEFDEQAVSSATVVVIEIADGMGPAPRRGPLQLFFMIDPFRSGDSGVCI